MWLTPKPSLSVCDWDFLWAVLRHSWVSAALPSLQSSRWEGACVVVVVLEACVSTGGREFASHLCEAMLPRRRVGTLALR